MLKRPQSVRANASDRAGLGLESLGLAVFGLAVFGEELEELRDESTDPLRTCLTAGAIT